MRKSAVILFHEEANCLACLSQQISLMLKTHLHVFLMFSVFNFQVRLVKLKSIVLNKITPHCHNDSHYPNAHWRVLFSVKLWGSWGKKVSEASGCWAVSRLQHQGRSERVLPANGSSVLTDRWVSPQGWNAQNNTRQNSCCTWSTHTHTHTHFYIPLP